MNYYGYKTLDELYDAILTWTHDYDEIPAFVKTILEQYFNEHDVWKKEL